MIEEQAEEGAGGRVFKRTIARGGALRSGSRDAGAQGCRSSRMAEGARSDGHTGVVHSPPRTRPVQQPLREAHGTCLLD